MQRCVCVRECEWIGGAEGNGHGAVRLGAVSAKQAGVSSGAENRGAWWSVTIQEEPWHLSSVDGGHRQKRQASATLSCARLLASCSHQRWRAGCRLIGRDNGHDTVVSKDELLSAIQHTATWSILTSPLCSLSYHSLFSCSCLCCLFMWRYDFFLRLSSWMSSLIIYSEKWLLRIVLDLCDESSCL